MMAVALAAACSGGPPRTRTPAPALPPPPAAPSPAPAKIGDAEIRTIAEITLMEDRRSLDPVRIAALASHWSPQVRRRAALAIGRLRDPAGVPRLLDLLVDSVMAVRVDAAFALGLTGDSSAATITTLTALARLHPQDSLGTEAAAALAKAGSAAAFDSLVAVIRSTPADVATPVAGEALVGLWRFGRRAGEAFVVIEPFTRSPDPAIRWRALYPLVRNGLPAGAPLSLELSRDPAAEVRALAVRGLRSPAPDSAGIRGPASAALRAALDDADPHVRINALVALASDGEAEHGPAVMTLLEDPDGNVRMAAVQALGSIGNPEYTSGLERVAAAADEKTGIRVAALGALAGIDAGRGAELATEWARSASWLYRMTAARTLGGAPWPVAREPLAVLAGDADARVARAAVAAVGRSAGDQAGYAILLDALRAPDPRVRAAALGAIARRTSAADLPIFMDAYEEAQRDTANDAAIAAVNALGTLGRAGSPVANAFFARFEPHPDVEVRRAVARRIGDQWGDPPEQANARGLAFYENVVRSLVVPAVEGGIAPILRIITPDGPIDIELAPAAAPLTVHNIISLVESGYYDSNGDVDARRWHRVVPNFVLQDGEPAGDGSGGPGYSIRDEINRLRYGRGVLGMALSGPDTGGGQFFITHSPQPHLDGGYTIFGRVVNGMETADAVVQDDRILGMEIVR